MVVPQRDTALVVAALGVLELRLQLPMAGLGLAVLLWWRNWDEICSG
jgi:hypothetical protein